MSDQSRKANREMLILLAIGVGVFLVAIGIVAVFAWVESS